MLEWDPLNSLLASCYRSCLLIHVAVLTVLLVNFWLELCTETNSKCSNWGFPLEWTCSGYELGTLFPYCTYVHAVLVNFSWMHRPSTNYDDLCIAAGSLSSTDMSILDSPLGFHYTSVFFWSKFLSAVNCLWFGQLSTTIFSHCSVVFSITPHNEHKE